MNKKKKKHLWTVQSQWQTLESSQTGCIFKQKQMHMWSNGFKCRFYKIQHRKISSFPFSFKTKSTCVRMQETAEQICTFSGQQMQSVKQTRTNSITLAQVQGLEKNRTSTLSNFYILTIWDLKYHHFKTSWRETTRPQNNMVSGLFETDIKIQS